MNWPQAVATTAVWGAVAVSLAAGLFQMSFSGGALYSFVLPIILTSIVVCGGVASTAVIWGSARNDDRSTRQQPPN